MTRRVLSVVMLVSIILSGCLLIAYSQEKAQDPQEKTQKGTADRSSQTTPTPKTGSDKSHSATTAASGAALTQLIEMNVAEIEAGKLASQKAQNARVKSYADMMVKDHTEALNKLKGLQGAPADVKPNTKHQQTSDRLSKLSGAEFDREYMAAMVKDHQEAVKFLEQHSGQNAGELAPVAKEVLPTVKMHLQEAQQIQKEIQGTKGEQRKT